jgi:hypothetical protein
MNNEIEKLDSYYIEIRVPENTPFSSIFDETYVGTDDFVYQAIDVTSQFVEIQKDLTNDTITEISIPVWMKKQIADDITNTVVLSESITTYGLPFNGILTNTTLPIDENEIHLYKMIIRSAVTAALNRTSKSAIETKILDIMKRFCEYHEKNATWDKCGQDYYYIKTILNELKQ